MVWTPEDVWNGPLAQQSLAVKVEMIGFFNFLTCECRHRDQHHLLSNNTQAATFSISYLT